MNYLKEERLNALAAEYVLERCAAKRVRAIKS